MRLILPIRSRRLPGWVRGRSLKTRSRQQESDKDLENLFNSLILRLVLRLAGEKNWGKQAPIKGRSGQVGGSLACIHQSMLEGLQWTLIIRMNRIAWHAIVRDSRFP
jgi:hypothetical protein